MNAAKLKPAPVVAPDMRERLIVGLDVPTLAEAQAVVRELEGTASFYKIGYQLAFAGASHLVVARPIIAARDRKAAARAILAEMEAAG